MKKWKLLSLLRFWNVIVNELSKLENKEALDDVLDVIENKVVALRGVIKVIRDILDIPDDIGGDLD